MDKERINSMGWERDLPDVRDMTAEAPGVDKVLSQSGPMKAVKKALPPKADLRKWCSPIEDQGQLGSCTANAGVGLMEYFERRAYGKHLDASRLFLYRRLEAVAGGSPKREPESTRMSSQPSLS